MRVRLLPRSAVPAYCHELISHIPARTAAMSVVSGNSATTRSSGAFSDEETNYEGETGHDAASVSTMDRTVSTLEPIAGACVGINCTSVEPAELGVVDGVALGQALSSLIKRVAQLGGACCRHTPTSCTFLQATGRRRGLGRQTACHGSRSRT